MRFKRDAKNKKENPVMSSEESSDPPLTRTDKVVGAAVGIGIPGVVIAVLIMSIAWHWPSAVRTGCQVLLFLSIVWVVLIFPKWWTRRKFRRLK
jgi:hypothetical protein